MLEQPSQSNSPKTDKAQLLGHFYGYIGGRIDSLSRRSSLLMVFLASYLGFVSSPLLKGEIATAAAKFEYALRHPSIVLGIAGILVLLWSELARTTESDDLFSRIVFTDHELGPLQNLYVSTSSDALFEHLIANMRGLGGLLRRKIAFYNIGSILFILSIASYVIGYSRIVSRHRGLHKRCCQASCAAFFWLEKTAPGSDVLHICHSLVRL